MPDELITRYAEEQILSNREQRAQMADRVMQDKVFTAAKNVVTLDRKPISRADFQKLDAE